MQQSDTLPTRVKDYIIKQWMPYKEAFATPWTGKYRHLGHAVSSRVESAHARIKLYFQQSIANLFVVYQKLRDADIARTEDIAIQIRTERDKLVRKFCNDFFSEVHGRISHKALDLVGDSVNAYLKPVPLQGICSGVTTTTWGISCRHRVYELLSANQVLPIAEFDSHWHLVSFRTVDISEELANLQPKSMKDLLAELVAYTEQVPPHEEATIRLTVETLLQGGQHSAHLVTTL